MRKQLVEIDVRGRRMVGWVPTAATRNTPAQITGGSIDIERGDALTVCDLTMNDAPSLVTLALVRRDNPLPGQDPTSPDLDAPLVAQIQWGADGVSEDCEVDWLNGTMITIPTANVRVNCIYPAVVGGEVNVRQNVGVIVTTTQRPPAAGGLPQARRTLRASLVSGASAQFDLPRRATSFYVLSNQPTFAGSFPVAQTSSPGRIVPIVTSRPTGDEVPVVGGARAVIVSNASPVDAEIALVFGISL